MRALQPRHLQQRLHSSQELYEQRKVLTILPFEEMSSYILLLQILKATGWTSESTKKGQDE